VRKWLRREHGEPVVVVSGQVGFGWQLYGPAYVVDIVIGKQATLHMRISVAATDDRAAARTVADDAAAPFRELAIHGDAGDSDHGHNHAH